MSYRATIFGAKSNGLNVQPDVILTMILGVETGLRDCVCLDLIGPAAGEQRLDDGRLFLASPDSHYLEVHQTDEKVVLELGADSSIS